MANPRTPRARRQHAGRSDQQPFTAAALPWAQRGIHVFPCKADKSPFTPNGFKDATTDEAKIQSWGKRYKSALVGVDLGRAGWVVLDTDPRDGGDESFAELGRRLPPTWCSITGGGGTHHFFQNPNGVGNRKPLPGLDIKGAGGYVIVPPSKGYGWHIAPDQFGLSEPAVLPDWLLELATKRASAGDGEPERFDVDAVLEGASRGERDDSAYRYACSMRARNLHKAEALILMERAWSAMEHGDDPFELERAIEKVERVWRELPAGASQELIHRARPAEAREEAFHGIAGEFVRLVEPYTEAGIPPMLVQFLAQIGNAMGRRPAIKIGGDRHGTNIFVTIVGDTAKSRKGTSYRKAGWAVVLADPGWDERKRTGISSGEGLLQMLQYEQMEAVETEKGITASSLGKRLMLFQPELAAVLRKMRRSESILSSILRDLWDRGKGGNWTVRDPIQVEDAHLSLIAHITELELAEELLTLDMANGFGNRFLWVCAQRSKLLPFAFEEDLADEKLAPIVARLRAVLAFARTNAPEAYSFDPKAREAWEDIYYRLEAPDPSLLGSMTSRSTPIVLRLALVYAVLDCSTVIKIEHLRAAVAVWDYCEQSAAYLFGSSTGNQLADRIYRFALDHPAGVTRKEINVDLLSGNKKSGDINRALALLNKRNLVWKLEKSESDKKGRPAEVWQATVHRASSI